MTILEWMCAPADDGVKKKSIDQIPKVKKELNQDEGGRGTKEEVWRIKDTCHKCWEGESSELVDE